MSLSISVVHVMIDDPDEATAFYRDVLGLKVQQEVERGGFRWVTLSTPDQPEIQIVLSQTHAARSAQDGDALAELLAKGELTTVFFRTDDLSGTFDRIAQVDGVDIVQEPTDQPWGSRDAAVRDPAGNLIRIQQA